MTVGGRADRRRRACAGTAVRFDASKRTRMGIIPASDELDSSLAGWAVEAPRARAREAKAADAAARRLRGALMGHHQGSLV